MFVIEFIVTEKKKEVVGLGLNQFLIQNYGIGNVWSYCVTVSWKKKKFSYNNDGWFVLFDEKTHASPTDLQRF